jgi:ribosomal protein S26
MTLFSHLTVYQFNEELKSEMGKDASALFHKKSDLVKVENLIQHTPRKFLKRRPIIAIYSVLKPLGLFEHFCETGGKKLSDNQCYIIAKILELKYKLIYPTIMLPLSVSEASKIYDETRSKSVLNLIGSAAPSGQFLTVRNRLLEQASSPIKVPEGFVITQHDNNQVIPKTHEMKTYNKQLTSVINANAHLVIDSENSFQYSSLSYPGHKVYRNLTENEIINIVPGVLTQYKPHYRATRKMALNIAIEHLKSDESHETHVENLIGLMTDYECTKFCVNCGVWTKRSDIRNCVDCDSKSALVKVTKEVIFNNFIKSAESDGGKLDVRFKPSAGFGAISRNDAKPHILVPGDPDMDPPTTKVKLIVSTVSPRLFYCFSSFSDQHSYITEHGRSPCRCKTGS